MVAITALISTLALVASSVTASPQVQARQAPNDIVFDLTVYTSNPPNELQCFDNGRDKHITAAQVFTPTQTGTCFKDNYLTIRIDDSHPALGKNCSGRNIRMIS